MKVAVFSMDVEDWYHLDYFDNSPCDQSQSLLDGIDVYKGILSRYGIKSSFFVLGELMPNLLNPISELAAEGHDIGVHGWNHSRPLKMSRSILIDHLQRAKNTLENITGSQVIGYRAPCFSLDRDLLDKIKDAGFLYDSSRILFKDHPLYGTLDMDGFTQLSPNIYHHGSFFEFQVSTLFVAGKYIPVSGGGYIRIFPWFIMKRLIKRYLERNELYVLYIHPFELSPQPSPPLPKGTKLTTRKRFNLGRSSVKKKLSSLIDLLIENGYAFMTFSELRQELLNQERCKTNHD